MIAHKWRVETGQFVDLQMQKQRLLQWSLQEGDCKGGTPKMSDSWNSDCWLCQNPTKPRIFAKSTTAGMTPSNKMWGLLKKLNRLSSLVQDPHGPACTFTPFSWFFLNNVNTSFFLSFFWCTSCARLVGLLYEQFFKYKNCWTFFATFIWTYWNTKNIMKILQDFYVNTFSFFFIKETLLETNQV